MLNLGGPNQTNSLTVDVSIAKDGQRIFTPQPTSATNLSWNTDHRRLDIAKPGRYFLTFNAQGFNFASPAVVFNSEHKGISIYLDGSNESPSQVTLLIATDATVGERASFSLVATTSGGGTEILDPTILVEPPGLTASDAPSDPNTLQVGISLVATDYIYSHGNQKLSGLSSDYYALIGDFGIYQVVFDAQFELAVPGIEFPQGQPSYITRTQVGNTVTLTVSVDAGMKPATVPLKIVPVDEKLKAPNDPTILVEPPGVEGE